MAPKVGRPPIPAAERKAAPLNIRMTLADRAEVEEAARRADLGLSAWARRILLAAARRTAGPASRRPTPPD